MDHTVEKLLSRAFARGPALEANTRIQQARELVAGAGTPRNYEVVVPAEATLAWFAETVVPRLVYHLESLGIRPPKAPGVFLSFFVGNELAFVHGHEVFAFLAEELGLTADELSKRYGTGERGLREVGQQHQPPLALPGPGR